MTEQQIASSSHGPEREGAELLFSGDIARLRGVTIATGLRWLLATEAKHGFEVVGRMGSRPYTTAAALLKIAPQWKGPAADHEARIRDLESALSVASKRVRVLEGDHERRLVALERAVATRGLRGLAQAP